MGDERLRKPLPKFRSAPVSSIGANQRKSIRAILDNSQCTQQFSPHAHDPIEREWGRVAEQMIQRPDPADAPAACVPSTTRQIPAAQLARNVSREIAERTGRAGSLGTLRFRVLLTSDLKALFVSGNVPENTIKIRVEMALTRMAKEGRLKTAYSIPVLMTKVFPRSGIFDEAEYENAVEVSDRSVIYKSVADAVTKVASADKPRLVSVMNDSCTLIDQSAADAVNLKLVFGSKDSLAKNIYGKAKRALTTAIANIDTSITTDYNLDDPEVGLGGWASFARQQIHFEPAIAKVTNVKEAKITIIHEASHLADASVDDLGYYNSNAFEGMSEAEKVTNAAHFEEIPRRKLGASEYGASFEFKPGQSKSGTPLTFDEKVRRKADEYLRKAWDKAVDVMDFLRSIRKEILGGSNASFVSKKTRIMQVSRLMNLTIHEQPAATATINNLDIVLAEGIAHATTKIQEEASKQSVPATPPLVLIDAEDFYARKVVDDSIKAYNALTGSFAGDKRLMDWLVSEYQRPL